MDGTRAIGRRLMAILLALVLIVTVMACGCSGSGTSSGGSDADASAEATNTMAGTYRLRRGTVAGSDLDADRVAEMRDEGSDVLLALGDDGSLTFNLYGMEQTGTWKLDDDSDTEGSASTDTTNWTAG